MEDDNLNTETDNFTTVETGQGTSNHVTSDPPKLKRPVGRPKGSGTRKVEVTSIPHRAEQDIELRQRLDALEKYIAKQKIKKYAKKYIKELHWKTGPTNTPATLQEPDHSYDGDDEYEDEGLGEDINTDEELETETKTKPSTSQSRSHLHYAPAPYARRGRRY